MRKCVLTGIDKKEYTYQCYTADEFPFHDLRKTALNTRTRNKYKADQYLLDYATFDIETSTIDRRSHDMGAEGFMYHWQMTVGGIPAYGRTWEEWTMFIRKIIEILELNYKRRLVIYVHNLGFEWQYICDFIAEILDSVFAVKSRRPLKIVTTSGLEFRCSYLLTNMSLEKACQNEQGVVIGKQSGNLDHKKLRTPKTVLTNLEFAYCMGDVISLHQFIKNRLINDRDNLESIPMTSTGYVRRDCRKACAHHKGYREMFQKLTITEHVYELLKRAARGGDTHANRYHSGKTLANIDSYDVQSSYPAMMCLKKFPMSKLEPYGNVDSKEELKELLDTKACLFTMVITNVELKDLGDGIKAAMPYIPTGKCRHLKGAVYDNGRVLSCEYLEMTVTDIDYRLIDRQYKYDEIYITDMHTAEYSYLPEPLRNVVKDYYYKKCSLKHRIENADNEEELKNLQYLYAKSKNRLNGIFGMCYTDPVRDDITWEIGRKGRWEEKEKDNVSEELEKYQSSRNSFLYYPWGVWITAHAREHLADLIDLCGQDASIYADTDSDKAYQPDEKAIEQRNREIERMCDIMGAYADIDGTRYYMGVYEKEKPYQKFKTLGAKKYAFIDCKGNLGITISGVAKSGAGEMGTIDNFRPGFTFHKSAGLELYYNDTAIRQITVNGESFTSASNIGTVESTYTIGLSSDYESLININMCEIT